MSDHAHSHQAPSRIGDLSTEHLRHLIQQPLLREGYELVECKWMARQKTVQISIDHTSERAQALGLDIQRSGISLDDCQAASQAISAVLDHQPPFSGDEEWTLEVSSPGVERPLLTANDFVRFAGLPVRVKLKRDASPAHVPAPARRQWLDATLVGHSDGAVALTWGPESISIALKDIERAHLHMAF